MSHDSHEEGYRYVQPQACIDDLRAAVNALMKGNVPPDDGRKVWNKVCMPSDAACSQARATLERTK